MKITKVDPILIAVPFDDGSSGKGIFPTKWDTLDFCPDLHDTGAIARGFRFYRVLER